MLRRWRGESRTVLSSRANRHEWRGRERIVHQADRCGRGGGTVARCRGDARKRGGQGIIDRGPGTRWGRLRRWCLSTAAAGRLAGAGASAVATRSVIGLVCSVPGADRGGLDLASPAQTIATTHNATRRTVRVARAIDVTRSSSWKDCAIGCRTQSLNRGEAEGACQASTIDGRGGTRSPDTGVLGVGRVFRKTRAGTDRSNGLCCAGEAALVRAPDLGTRPVENERTARAARQRNRTPRAVGLRGPCQRMAGGPI